MADPTRVRSKRRILAALAFAAALAACEPGPTQAPSSFPVPTALASQAAAGSGAPAGPSAAPATPRATAYPAVPPRSVAITTGVPATTTCSVPEGRTLRLTELSGTVAYGYEAELTPWSLRDPQDSAPVNVSRTLARCDLQTGSLTLLQGPDFDASGDADLFGRTLYIVELDANRLLLRAGPRQSPGTWLLDLASGGLTRLDAFVQRNIEPTAIDADVVSGSWSIREAFSEDSLPALADLRTGDFRILTGTDIGAGGTWLWPADIDDGYIVGDADNADTSLPGRLWAVSLGTAQPVEVPSVLARDRPFIGGLDAGVVVGSAVRDPDAGTHQPFAWRIGEPDVTWLAMPDDQIIGHALDIRGPLIVGETEGIDPVGDWARARRAIVWDLASGEMLDLGLGPAELSGTRVTDGAGPPQSVASAVDGTRVLGFLGDSCGASLFCEAASFGGTPLVWDITEWLTSINA